MTVSHIARALCAVALLVALGACEGIKNQLGLSKSVPDEFRVVSRAPLSLPPEFTLRPPEPGATRPQEGTTVNQARSAVFKAPGQEATGLEPTSESDRRTRGERALLMSAGADRAQPGIRQSLNSETQDINEANADFIDDLVFWRAAQQPGVVVDPEAEAQRLRTNAALGRPSTSGQTPTIERKKKAIFEGLF